MSKRSEFLIKPSSEESEISHSLCEKLTWAHIRNLSYIEDELKRRFYLELCAYERWSVQTLKERMKLNSVK
ncbi:MAG: hypothetical protein A2103_04470 [Gammaproteobacteria bacterium GWF2_41_13]|nr:MAG: hypothetical protein A2103_04470 [Gammaproteobacteria bacterium GWF2_41_13]